MRELLDPRNDFVFKKIFVKRPDLLADLINAVRSDEAPVEIVEVLNPAIAPEDMEGKFIVLDVLVRDAEGRFFNVEMQVRFTPAWVERSLYYLARAYVEQLKRGENYISLKPVIGIDLLDFDLFEGPQAHWRFRLRDDVQSDMALNVLQLHVLELRKLDRLHGSIGVLQDWIRYFRHSREDKIMSEIRHPPVREALGELKELSMDDEAYWRARTRELALYEENTHMYVARMEGRTYVLERQLILKFNELPASVRQRLKKATEKEVDLWTERVLFAATLDEVFR